ncbi:hypothetical protein WJX72_002762 [[Myrmecia] bisecta]|uniref:AP2/ERF domain-containing protein n=1 Tax=[Myrmecia] bisecta TaxID=41462 RepID=A0AAW1QEI3_9CHLO
MDTHCKPFTAERPAPLSLELERTGDSAQNSHSTLVSPSGFSYGSALPSPMESGAAQMRWPGHLSPHTPGEPSTSGDHTSGHPRVTLQQAAQSFPSVPSIFKRRRVDEPDIEQELGVHVVDWTQLKKKRHGFLPPPSRRLAADPLAEKLRAEASALSRQAVQKVSKVSKTKGHAQTGRTYTSKYRGVHQTFPTKRWEAQFRRNGKPTSLGCFDAEEQAARAYDKMMLWCELHNSSGVKGGITNFDPAEYEKELAWLHSVTQDELVQALRSDGRRQAAQRMLRQKRDGQLVFVGDLEAYRPPSA